MVKLSCFLTNHILKLEYSIHVKETKEHLKDQWRKLSMIAENRGKKNYRTYTFWLLLMIIGLTCLIFFSSSQSFIVLKGVSCVVTALALMAYLVYSVWFLVHKHKQRAGLEKMCDSMERLGDEELISIVILTDDQIIVESGGERLEQKWEVFAGWKEMENVLYVFNLSTPMQTLMITAESVNKDDYDMLKQWVAKKLKGMEVS